MTTGTQNLLIEIGCEELPPADLNKLATHFAKNFAGALHAAEVLADENNFTAFATPRRLAVLVGDVADKAPSRVVDARGPSVSAAFDANGKPTKAALGFAKSNGVAVAKLTTVKTDKGDYLIHRKKVTGKKIADIVTETLADVIRTLPVAKKMRWGAGDAEFVRPVHWLLALHGNKIVKTEALGIKATGFTYGHRFHAPAKLKIPNADVYEATLNKKGMVIADFGKRRAIIQKQLNALANKVGANVVADDALLDVVTGMVEYPRAVMGDFDERFLKLPAEVLIACMRTHQKYFHLIDTKGKLLSAFITIANIKSNSTTRVKIGNERVVRARLSDAEFFYETDLKTPLVDRVMELSKVSFHKELGSLFEKTLRIVELTKFITAQFKTKAVLAEDAARFCKLDLVTNMVGEFPELQGVIGCAYAKHSRKSKPVAEAIAEHYLPRYAGDQLPSTSVAQSVAIADRLDSLIGLFAAGEIPGGDRDPFALRRAALGVLRIMIEKKLDLDLRELLNFARLTYLAKTFTDGTTEAAIVMSNEEVVDNAFNFMLERLRGYYQSLGYSAAELNAVMACRPTRPLDFDHRLKALRKFFAKKHEAAESLAAANKRIAGILRKVDEDISSDMFDKSLILPDAETELVQKLYDVHEHADLYFTENKYDKGLAELSKLKEPVDNFFDKVLVMDEDPNIRRNRIALLNRIRELFLRVADISLMSTDK